MVSQRQFWHFDASRDGCPVYQNEDCYFKLEHDIVMDVVHSLSIDVWFVFGLSQNQGCFLKETQVLSDF